MYCSSEDSESSQDDVAFPNTSLSPKKVVHPTHGDNFVLTDFQNSFTAGKPGKFPIKPI